MGHSEWRKSTRSGGNGGDCVEVAGTSPGVVAVRDSKNPTGPVLTFTFSEWKAFLDTVRTRTEI